MDSAVLMSSAACGLMGVVYAHNPGVCMRCGAWATPRTGGGVWWVHLSPRYSLRTSPRISTYLSCQVCVWLLGAG